ncbi:hypothetical protein LBMAG42_56030 [Deltaproteobacteria bacterium]|nr:hypothetical protein LBMAG42_56030 [Deltaproteobacteria bacterium]
MLFRSLIMLISIAWHELGHLLAARLFGVGVQEYSIGIGPRVMGFRVGATRYTLRLLPIGGYVDPANWDDVEDKEDLAKLEPVERKLVQDPRNWLANKTLFQRVLLFFAGPAFNIGLAAAVLAVVGLAPGWSGCVLDVIGGGWDAQRRGAMLGFDYGEGVSALNHMAWIEDSWGDGYEAFFRHVALVNLYLGLLNLLPIPPLDGSQIIKEVVHELHHGHLGGRKLHNARQFASAIWIGLSLIGLSLFVVIQFV